MAHEIYIIVGHRADLRILIVLARRAALQTILAHECSATQKAMDQDIGAHGEILA